MRDHRARQATRDALIAFAFLIAAAMPALARPPQDPPTDRSNPERERQQDMNRREMLLRATA